MSANSKTNPESDKYNGQHALRTAMIWCVGGFLLVPASLVAVLYLPAVQQRLLQRLVTHLEAGTTIRIQYQTYNWSPPSELRLNGLRVQSATKELLKCQAARLNYHLYWKWPFLVPTELTLQKPVLYLQKDSRGRWIFPKTWSKRTRRDNKAWRRWLHFPWPDLKIVSGEILGFQESRQILTMHNVNGTLSLQMIRGPNGPSLKVGLDHWQGMTKLP